MKDELPENVDEWDLPLITKILQAGYYESDKLEFKEDFSDKERIPRTACGFANTDGGFFIFGVSDKREKSVPERLIGMDKSRDNVATISDQIGNIKPQLSSNIVIFRQSPIDLGNNKEIIIMKISPSEKMHEFENKYYKKGQAKNEFFSPEELELKILEKKREETMMKTLYSELCYIDNSVKSIREFDSYNVEVVQIHIKRTTTTALENFYFNHTYLYNQKIFDTIKDILFFMRRLKAMKNDLDQINSWTDEVAKEHYEYYGCKSTEELVFKESKYYSDEIFLLLKILRTELNLPPYMVGKMNIAEKIKNIKIAHEGKPPKEES